MTSRRNGATVRWGVLGTGVIAQKFVAGVHGVEGHEVVAVGSRAAATATTFAAEFGVARSYGNYAELAEDPAVDVVYVATPHPSHEEHATVCLGAGKAVLCEKPLTINAAQATRLVELARANRCFLMEGMWTRFFPLMTVLRKILADGAIGDVRSVLADFGYRTQRDPTGRRFDPALGGGALLDVGVYCVALASMVFGEPPRQVAGCTHLGDTGVDEQSAAVLGYQDGKLASLSCGITARTPQRATIVGTAGYVQLDPPWWRPEALSIWRDGESESIRRPYTGNGFAYEAAEVGRCVEAGLLESDIMPLDESIEVARTMDSLRELWGLTYPGEPAQG